MPKSTPSSALPARAPLAPTVRPRSPIRGLLLAVALACLLGAASRALAQEPPPDPPDPAEGERAEEDRADEDWEEEDWGDEDWEDDEGGESGRHFIYKEAVLSVFYAPEGVSNLPPDDRKPDYVEFSPRPPGTYVGLDYVGTFTSTSLWNRYVFPTWMPLSAVDLHPRIVWDRTERSDSSDQIKFVPQDFWARFLPGNVDRLSLRVGQFVIPYGVDPIMAPRHVFILPVEVSDLGFKWDWGVGCKGPLGEYDWDVAATLGTGDVIHESHFFKGGGYRSYLFSGRIGAPAYWDFRYGISGLYGEVPLIRGPIVGSLPSASRWRVGLDSMYKYGTYLLFGGQVTYGQDGFAGDAEFVPLSEGRTADVLGYRVWLDWVVPWHTDLRLAYQFESVIKNLSESDSDLTAMIFEVGYSVTTSINVKLDYRVEINRPVGKRFDAIYLSVIYYAL